MKPGDMAGVWNLVSRLGSGGNGEVWKARAPDGTQAAVKILRPTRKRERLGRFRNEINFLLRERSSPGVVPIIDSNLAPSSGQPWYSMPIAQTITGALGSDPTVDSVVGAVSVIAETLARLAQRDIAHRDLKPDNLFKLDAEWVVGDFGLVSYPEADPLTAAGRKLGPTDYLAPEMRRDADRSDPKAADVWALAKTLWVLLLPEERVPLPGPHRHDDPAYALTSRIVHSWSPYLDSLLRRATFVEPERRIMMADFASELTALPIARSARTAGRHARRLIAGRLDQLAEADEARSARFNDVSERLMRASGPPHDVLYEAVEEVRSLLPRWHHASNSDYSVHAYELMSDTDQFWDRLGRFNAFSVARPYSDGRRVTISLSVGLRLDTTGESLTIGGGVRFEDGFAEPTWLRSVVREVPLSSSLEMEIADELRHAFSQGIDEALTRADEALRAGEITGDGEDGDGL